MRLNRVNLAICAVSIISIGLLSRSKFLAPAIPANVGDALYATLIYFLLAVFWPKFNPKKRLLSTIGFCFLVEFSQLATWPWLVQLRQTLLGKLILGQGFLWQDLVAYCIGALLAWALFVKLFNFQKSIS